MEYHVLVEVYINLEKTSKRLEKTSLVSKLLAQTTASDLERVISLLQGKVFPVWDERKIGFSVRLAMKAISIATGIAAERI